jgi:hypothetical protein
MDVGVDTAGSNDFPFGCDYFGSWSNNYVNVRLHIRITGFPNRCNQTILDSNIRLEDSRMIQN